MIKKYKSIKETGFFFFLSYLSILAFSFFLYSTHFSQVLSYEIVLKSIITSVILWYILYLSSFHRWFYYFVVFLLTIITTIKIYYSFILGVHIEPSVFEGMFDTNLDEAKRLGSSKPFFIFFAILSFIAIVIEFNWLKSFTFKKRMLVHLFKIFAIIILLIGYGTYKHNLNTQSLIKFVKQAFPISFVNYFYQAGNSRYRLYKMNQSKIDIVKKYNFTQDNDTNLTVVFARAESLRSRSFPIINKSILSDYRIDDIDNIVYYNNVYSYANYTQAAVPWMLTRSVNDKLQNEKSLISVIKHVGFNTTWIGCDHSNLANFATPIVNYSLEANNSLFLGKLDNWQRNHKSFYNKQQKYFIEGKNGYDGSQFSYAIDKLKKQNSNIFFWIEMNGSHIPWTSLTPNKFKIYKPFCKKSLDAIKTCSEEESTNSYKNTILYSQYLLKKLILSLKNKNAIVFFASDHGESTGENGYYGHGFMLPEDKRKIRDQINPAFMVWMSDTFKKNHQIQFNNLKNNSTKTMKHDIIFHSVLDILGIKSPIIDKTKSIFSNTFIGRGKKFTEIQNKKNIIISSFLANKATFHLTQSNPKSGTVGKINFKIYDTIKNIKITISDLYKKLSFPNRIKYRVIYHGKIIVEKDLAEDNQTLAQVDFLPNDHNITVEIEAQEGIEKDWSWGHAGKIQIDFMEKK